MRSYGNGPVRTGRVRVKLSFVSWNLHGIPYTEDPEARFTRVAQRVRELEPAPDLLLFQEVWSGALGDQLRADLPDYEAPQGLERSWLGQRPSGLMAFVRKQSGWSLNDVDFHEFQVTAPWWRIWEADGLGRKGVQQLHLRNGGDELAVLHTHLQAMYGKPEYAVIAADQLRELTAVAQSLGVGRPIIAAGDLNTRIDTPRYAELRASWIDLTTEFRERCDCGTSVRDDGKPGAWIDYVLAYKPPRYRASVDIQLLANRGRDDPFSDHNGFFVKLSIDQSLNAGWLLGAALATNPALRRRDLLRGGAVALAFPFF